MRQTDRKRRAILEAAAAEFQRDGFDGASMNRIAAAAEVSKRTVYNHFPSKEDLFEAIVGELIERVGNTRPIDYDPDVDSQDQLNAIGVELAERMMSEEVLSLARVAVSRFIHAPEIAAKTIDVHEQCMDGLIRWIKAAKKDGRLSVGNEVRAARLFTAVIQEFAFWPQLIGSEKKLSRRELIQIVRTATQMFLCQYAT